MLDDQLIGPDDAFEAALLDANTGASLSGALNLTRTDALFNLQANGTERVSQGITRIDNADGSRTYLVDLSGIAAPTDQQPLCGRVVMPVERLKRNGRL